MKTENSEKPKCSFGISSLDLVGTKFSFEFPTFSRKLKTKPGSGLTLVIGVITIVATAIIGSKYFDTSSPSITFSNEIGPEISHNMVKELMLPPITVYQEGSPLQTNISKMATIKAVSATYLFNPVTSYFKMISSTESDYVDCKELNDPYFNQMLEKIDNRNKFKNILKCPDFKGNYNLSDVLFDSKNILYKYLSLSVFPCSLDDPSQCATAAEINKMRVVVGNPKKTIDPSNYTHPYKTTVTTEEIPLNPLTIKVRKHTTRVTKITDLRNDFFGPETKGEFMTTNLFWQDSTSRLGQTLHCKKENGFSYGGVCAFYIAFEFEGGSEVIQVKRKYNLPTEIIGEIGGVLKVALMFGMVYTIYNQAKQKSSVIENIFSSQKKNRRSQVRTRRMMQGEEDSKKEQGSEKQGKIKFLPTNQSRSGPRHKNLRKLKEECFQSTTDFTKVIENVNYLDVLERLGLNELSKKLLQEAILIKQFIEKSPILRERFETLKIQPISQFSGEKSTNELPEQSEENSQEKGSSNPREDNKDDENNDKKHSGSPLKVKRLVSFKENEEELKELFRTSIENLIRFTPQAEPSRSKIEAKFRESLHWVGQEVGLVDEIPPKKQFSKKGILKSRKPVEVARIERSEENSKHLVGSEEGIQDPKTGNQEQVKRLSSVVKRPKQARSGLRGRKKFGSSASLGRKILFKSRFTNSKKHKKSTAKKL